MRIKVDPYVFPQTPIIPREVFSKKKEPSLTEEYMLRSKQNYFEDGGIKVVDIDVVEIVARRIATYDYSSSLNDFNTVSGDMTRFSSIYDVLQRFRQLEIVGNDVYVLSKKSAHSSVSSQQESSSAGGSGDGDGEAGGGSDITDVEINMDEKQDLMPAVDVNGTQLDFPSTDDTIIPVKLNFEETNNNIFFEFICDLCGCAHYQFIKFITNTLIQKFLNRQKRRFGL